MIEVKKSNLNGSITIPPSKSHTIRAIAFATLSKNPSIIYNPLISKDTLAAVRLSKAFGAKIEMKKNMLVVFPKKLIAVQSKANVQNSGTTLRIFTAIAALQEKTIELTGDSSTKKRPMKPLLDALKSMGAKVSGNSPPFRIHGPVKGGNIAIESKTSQFLTSLLIISPLLPKDTIIKVTRLNEKPYVEMTLSWMKQLGIKFKRKKFSEFHIPGKQAYSGFRKKIPADWSGAAFPLAASLLSGSNIVNGLDMDDTQGDKKIIRILKKMGAKITVGKNITAAKSSLHGIAIDLNENPDLLPIIAVLACFAEGTTRIYKVAHARTKESDRISVMCRELSKLGANVKELPDGLVIKKSVLKPAVVDGHKDHRIIMALICAGLAIPGRTLIKNTSRMDVSYPNFISDFKKLGARIRIV